MNNEEKRIEELQNTIQELNVEISKNDSDYPANLNPINRCAKEIELIKLGFKVDQIKHCAHGFVIDDKYLIAYQQKKWCTNSKRVWYFYDSLEVWKNRYYLGITESKKDFSKDEKFKSYQLKLDSANSLSELTTINGKTFIESLQKFLTERGYLTPKQEDCLDSIIQTALEKREKKWKGIIDEMVLLNQNSHLN